MKTNYRRMRCCPRSCRLPFALLMVGVLWTTPNFAQDIQLVADLNPTLAAQGSSIYNWVRAGELLYFMRREPDGSVLWRTDGTLEGTAPLREFQSRSNGLLGGELPDGRLIFTEVESSTGQALWISDGTSEGTRYLANLCPDLCSTQPLKFVRLGDELLFQMEDRLFATDGSDLRLAADLFVQDWQVIGDRIFFLERNSLGRTLWVSDAQPGSEVRVRTLDAIVYDFGVLGESVLIIARDLASLRVEAWLGDENGLERITDEVEPPGERREFRGLAAGPSLAYVAFDRGLWRTDGTAEGSFRLPAVAGGTPDSLTFAADALFFVYFDPALGRELWRTDGTPNGTLLMGDLYPGSESSQPKSLTAFDDELLFFAESESGLGLWLSDATAEGTRELRTFQRLETSSKFGLLADRFFFSADGSDTGLEPWSSDGTAEGTRLFANLLEDEASSDPSNFVARASDLTFLAEGGAPETELFRVDTADSVQLAFLSDETFVELAGPVGDRVFLTERSDRRFGPTRVSVLDPVTSKTEEIAVVPRAFESTIVGDRLFFIAGEQGLSGSQLPRELRMTDGTAAGSSLLLEGVWEDDPIDYSQLAWGDRLAFTAINGELGNELWITDGTAASTQPALDLYPGAGSSNPLLLAADQRLYLQANVGESSRHLVVTDGTPGQTSTTALDNLPTSGGVLKLGDRLVWISTPGDGASELWTSDGTSAGTLQLATFAAADALVQVGNQAFFAAATSEHGSELWVSDGSSAGTRRVLDIEPGPVSSNPEEMTAVDGKLLFVARTAATGSEPWVSDGTSQGTQRLADLFPGPRGSQAQHFTPFGDQIFFAARRPDVGRELFAIPRSALDIPCVPDDTVLCLNSERFRVEVQWRDFEDERGPGRVVDFQSRDSGLFYFFSLNNWEMLVKVLDGCQINGRFWVFAAATTDVEYTLRVTDLVTGESETYFNPLGVASRAVTDTAAFDTCP